MFVQRLKSNVKRGFDGELAPLTLVVGTNAAGKTGLVTSLELALTGRSESIGALGAELLTLCANPPLAIEVQTDAGEAASFSVAGSTSKASKPKRGGPEGVMLGRLVLDILTAEPKRQRAALLQACTANMDLSQLISAALPDAFRAQWNDFWLRTPGDSAGDKLVEIQAAVRLKLREVRALVAPPSTQLVAPSEEEIAELREAVSVAEDRQRLPELVAERSALLPQLQSAMVGPNPQHIKRAVEAMRALVVALDYAAHAKLQCCIACEAVADPQKLLESALSRRARGEKALYDLRDVQPGIGERVAWLTEEIARIERLPTSGESLEATRTKLDAAWTRQREANHAAAELKAYVAAQTQIDALKALEAACDRIIQSVLLQEIAKFEVRAASVAPVTVQLFDGAKSVCRVGLRQLGTNRVVPWKALSGAERAQLVAGVAAAVGATASKDKLRLVVIDDVWLDNGPLADLCGGLAVAVKDGSIDQAVVCAVKTDAKPKGWKRIDLS